MWVLRQYHRLYKKSSLIKVLDANLPQNQFPHLSAIFDDAVKSLLYLLPAICSLCEGGQLYNMYLTVPSFNVCVSGRHFSMYNVHFTEDSSVFLSSMFLIFSHWTFLDREAVKQKNSLAMNVTVNLPSVNGYVR